MMLLAIYSILWEQSALADRDRLYQAEWARLTPMVHSAVEARQPKEGSQPGKSPLKTLVSALGHTWGWEAS